MAIPRLGPALSATICTPCLDRSLAAWRDGLQHAPVRECLIDDARAAAWGIPILAGQRSAQLANTLGDPWLELIEAPGAEPADPFRHRGWFSLEISVANVDALWRDLEGSAFRVIGEPANLDFSDDIRAMQVIGPAGEVLYLTQVKAPVPPFELPFARCAVDRLFIPVLFADDSDAALAVYAGLSGTEGIRFDTKITVINRARGLDLATRHPVAALQLAGSTLIEIDQLDGLRPRDDATGLPVGIAAVGFAAPELPPGGRRYPMPVGPLVGRNAVLLRGAAGERIELVESA